jgi:hypothetical protein
MDGPYNIHQEKRPIIGSHDAPPLSQETIVPINSPVDNP